MIIFSQDKNTMISTDKIVCVKKEARQQYDELGKELAVFWTITAELVNQKEEFLGIYYSNERAEKMMTEILKLLVDEYESTVLYMFDD